MSLELFHPAVARWFARTFPAPTDPQLQAWPEIKKQRHTLIAAPTGSGKTLAAFMSAIDDLVRLGVEGKLDDTTHVIYVSPLKALSNDVQRNLQTPLEGIQKELQAMGLPEVNIRTLVRTGDTPASERTAMTKRPPHVVVTTPESLYILLTSEGGRRMLETARTLIVDEIHAVVSDKRGSHLALSIERLEQLTANKLVRIGLSATQRPIEEVARFLVGTANIDAGNTPQCAIVDSGHARKLDIGVELTDSPLQAVMSGEVWEEVYDRLAHLIRQHHTTLVFVTLAGSPSECRAISANVWAMKTSPLITAVWRANNVFRGATAQSWRTQRAGSYGVARIGHRHRRRESGLPAWLDSFDCQFSATRRALEPHGRRFSQRQNISACRAMNWSSARRLSTPCGVANWIGSRFRNGRSIFSRSRSSPLSLPRNGPKTICSRWSGVRIHIAISNANSLIRSFACWRKASRPSVAAARLICITTRSTSDCAAGVALGLP